MDSLILYRVIAMTPTNKSKLLLGVVPGSLVVMYLLLANHTSVELKPDFKELPSASPTVLPLQVHPHPVRSVAHRRHSVEVVHVAVLDSNRMNLHPLGDKQKYVYTFEGIATYDDQRCPNASILVRLSTADETRTVGGVTNADGTYSIQVPINAAVNDPIDWVVEGFTPDFQKVEMTGRRIVAKEDDPVTLVQPLAFLR